MFTRPLAAFSLVLLMLGPSLLIGCMKQTKPAVAPGPAQPAAEPNPTGRLQVPPAATIDVERVFSIAPSSHAPKIGKDEAKVSVLVCSDFECPFCAKLVPTVHELVENYGDLIQVSWRHCPLPFHEHAVPASEAAVEVYTQAGDKGFWAFHDILFANQASLEAAQLVALAKQVEGVDGEKVKAALADHRHVNSVRADLTSVIDSGAASGGFGTPATFVNGRLLAGAQPYDAFEQAVERALAESPEAYTIAKERSELAYPMARARHILIQYKGAQGAEPKVTRSKEEARALADKLAQRIKGEKADMAQLARENSDCPSAPEGGELGRFTKGDLVPEFEAALFALQPGQTSGVVETPFGFHIIEREP
jgi:protein-disulfide isomerase